MWRWLTIALALVVGAAAGGWWYVDRELRRPRNFGDELYVIPQGGSLGGFARELVERRVMAEPYSLLVHARLDGRAHRIRAGEYRFETGSSLDAMLDKVVAGDVVQYPITFIEGWTFREFRAALEKAPKLRQELTGMSDDEVMAHLGHPGIHPEGRFFPDTYRYTAGMTDNAVLRRAFETMERRLAYAWAQRSDDCVVDSPYQALVLASIIEKETGVADERPLIGGVFSNRVRRGMRLQTDPTVIYGLGNSFDGNLTRDHLNTDNPYNTYTRAGLPPTPIAAPGYESLLAAVQPRPTDALYFVSRGDGTHEFSTTLKDHQAAVRKYQLNR